ncbi:MAG: ABC transporter ATP-binding protein [Oscillospiraceae bacterium]|nr:ABC transporter ATP-binding protein [Oscillospiraceae bacterium]
MKKIIELKGVTKSFDGETVLDNISLDIYDNEFITLLGPSGCGKTTTLRLIGGFETPDAGDILFMGQRINDVPPHKRNVNTVFQWYALFPHLNVFENVAFPLREQKVAKDEIQERVENMLSMVALKGFEHRGVTRLSGGQQQRVAIARALISHPQVLLLDEPLAALDLKLRKDMQQELKNIQKATGITFVFVTHDQEEALSMSDTIVVMSEGKIQQIGTSVDVYNEPQNAFVADFIGESNILDGMMLADLSVSFSGQTFVCVDKGFGKNEPVDVVVRPEDVDIVPPEKGMLTGVVTSVTFMGVHYEVIVDIGGFKWMIQTTDFVDVDERIGLYIEPDAIHIMKKSEYSGLYGDYSSFSNELDELSDAESEPDE